MKPLIWQFIVSHRLAIEWFLFAAVNYAITTMPMPGPNDSKAYQWAFAFLHSFIGNLSRAGASRKMVP